ncbi:class I SAM-dependent methyltransferase [Azospirillum sp. YIM DDC1]|uniref:Class I SAM-dependent methyltransferase n=1 Tax=Azospirillum aestuarii TaxID=2802052 RepID=A0ABS1I6V7_9PROT|nr:class I SAM-dependent methyltransferase [Azospirillum aestuarii]MBK4722806.1 class I SAM-dependent methyltransferase [Azospirillum aestuarii]
MHPRYRQTCRVCGSTKLKPVIDLGDQYLQGSFVKPGVLMPPTRKLPTQLVRCDVTQDEHACGLLQLAHSFPPEILYANYWYRSGTNATMRNHLHGIVDSVMELIGRPAPTVLDIGCNDGTLLFHYPEGTTRYGVDPSDIANEIADRATVVNTVFPSEQALAVLPKGGLDVVTSIAMFYDLEDPVGFASAIAGLLKPEGVWVFEMSYLPLMLVQNSFDTVCHEHLEYYSLSVLETIAAKAGLRIFKAELNDINGGSIRCYATHAANLSYGKPEDKAFLHRLRIQEFEMELDTDKPYRDFQQRIETLREELNRILFDVQARRGKVHIYGASTKGNVLLQWYGINRLLVDCAAERNPGKVGARTLGTDIPIVSEEESRAQKPDYYLVLPWHFKREFLEREREAIMNGTKMLFPLPTVEVVDRHNYEAALASAATSTEMLTALLLDGKAAG